LNSNTANSETAYCKFHPLDTAINFCPQCDADYCETCSDESFASRPSRSRGSHATHCCFICEGELEPFQRAQQIPPFWTRLGRIYMYPLNSQAIVAIIILSFVTALIGASLILLLLVTVIMALYTFTCLRETANGHLEAPGLEACFEGSLAPLFYMLVALIVQAAIVYQVFNKVGFEFGLIAAAFFIVSIPAMIILIVTEESLAAALNPAQLFEVIRATGVSYFVMLLFLIIMMSSVAAIKRTLMYWLRPENIKVRLSWLSTNLKSRLQHHGIGRGHSVWCARAHQVSSRIRELASSFLNTPRS